MVQPASVVNTRGQSIDSIYGVDGVERVKLAIGDKDVTLSPSGSWQGVATHVDGDAFDASDGIVVVGGVDFNDGTTPRRAMVDAEGRLVVALQPTAGAITDRSVAVTLGGTAEDLMVVNLARKYLLIINDDPAEDLWFDFGVNAVAASPSMLLSPGESFVMEASFVTSDRVSILAATTAHAVTAKEG